MRRHRSFSLDLVGYLSFVLGAVLGGLVTGFGLFVLGGLLSWVPFQARAAIFLAVALTCGLVEYGIIKRELPQRKEMILPDRFDVGVRRGLLFFGFELGLGFRTYIPRVGPYLLAAAALLLAGSGWHIVVLAVGWAVGRGAIVLARVLVGSEQDRELGIRRMADIDGTISRLAGIACALQLGLTVVLPSAVT